MPITHQSPLAVTALTGGHGWERGKAPSKWQAAV